MRLDFLAASETKIEFERETCWLYMISTAQAGQSLFVGKQLSGWVAQMDVTRK